MHSTEKWKLVVGHHPIFSVDGKHGSTPGLIEKIKPILEKYTVDFYFAGHIRNFQHLRMPENNLECVVTSSAARPRPRPDSTVVNTLYSSPEAGFGVCSVNTNTLKLYFVNSSGKTLYVFKKHK